MAGFLFCLSRPCFAVVCSSKDMSRQQSRLLELPTKRHTQASNNEWLKDSVIRSLNRLQGRPIPPTVLSDPALELSNTVFRRYVSFEIWDRGLSLSLSSSRMTVVAGLLAEQ